MRAPPPRLDATARIVQRLAVLLRAGVPPRSAWGYLAETDHAAIVRDVAAAAESGGDLGEVMVRGAEGLPAAEASAWRALAAAWSVALDSGAPLAATLREFAGTLRALSQIEREIAIALSAPVATAKLVMALPAVGVAFGLLLGFDTLRVLALTPVGWACCAIAGLLLFVASRWNRRLVAAARPATSSPGLEEDLLAIAVAGGASLDRARSLVADTLWRFDLVPGAPGAVDDILRLSARAGVPAAELLRSEAEEARLRERAEAQRRAAALSVTLMLPLGLCVLPAFLVVGVVPLLVAVISSTVAGF